MDWSRAKNILIITFLILDIFLATQIGETIKERSQVVETNKITDQQLMLLLNDNRIRLSASRPEEKPFPPLIARLMKMSHEWKQTDDNGYSQSFLTPPGFKTSEEQKRFLRKTIPNFERYHLLYSTPNKQIYLQSANNYLFFDGRLELSLEKGKLKNIYILPYQIVKKAEPINPIPFNNALYRLIDSDRVPRETVITNIYLGYRARSHPQEINDVYLIPYWCFITKKGQAFYINALSNALSEEIETARFTD